MADGTLLGSYFFHDIIPWDDDVDLMVDYNDYPRLKKAYHNKTIWSNYNLYGYHDSFNEYEFELLNTTFPDRDVEQDLIPYTNISYSKRIKYHKLKIFSTNGKRLTKNFYKWPYIDVTFFKHNGNHFWNHDKIRYSMPVKDFFPFHLRPFMGMWLPAPHKTALFLKQKILRYSKSGSLKCQIGMWDHKKEEDISMKERVSVPCASLDSVYVRITRSKLEDGKTNESAIISGKNLYSTYVDEYFDDASLKLH